MTTPAEGLQRLRDAAASGLLDAFCARHGVRVLTVFGSAARGAERARDLDVGVLTQWGTAFDAVAAVGDLIELTGTDAIDLAHLNRGGPVLRERALVCSVGLYESEPAALADAQAIAIAERIETDPMRRLNLRLLASTPPALDWRSVERKLTRMRRMVDQLAELGPFDGPRFANDPIAGLAAERLLTLLVELAFGVNSHVSVAVIGQAPDSYRESFLLAAQTGMIDDKLAATLAPAAGLRNVLVHACLDADHDRVAEATRLAPEQFAAYVRQASRWFAERSGAV